MKAFPLWLLSLTSATAAVLLWPPLRRFTPVPLILHLPFFLRGIFDLRSGFFVQALCQGDTRSPLIAITLDDGPDPQLTPAILDLLKHHRMRATFFMVGERVSRYPAIVRRAWQEGHTIACHDLYHRVTDNFRIQRFMERDIRESCDRIEQVIGLRPLLYRPPVGLANPHLAPVLHRLGLTCIGWSRSARDGGNRFSRRISRIGTLAGPGQVLLCHDTAPDAHRAGLVLTEVEKLLTSIKKQGLLAVTVDQLFSLPAYARTETPAAADPGDR